MLKVTVAEVQRAILKQFGINLGAVINSGNFATAILSQNALPITAAAGLGTLPLSGVGTGGARPDHRADLRDLGRALQLQSGHSRQQRLRQLGRDQLVRRQQRADGQRAAGARARRPRAHAGRAQPDRRVGRDRQLPGRRRVPDSRGRQRRQADRHVQEVRCRPGVHAGRPVGRPHQPEDRDRGERAHPRTARSSCRASASRP